MQQKELETARRKIEDLTKQINNSTTSQPAAAGPPLKQNSNIGQKGSKAIFSEAKESEIDEEIGDHKSSHKSQKGAVTIRNVEITLRDKGN